MRWAIDRSQPPKQAGFSNCRIFRSAWMKTSWTSLSLGLVAQPLQDGEVDCPLVAAEEFVEGVPVAFLRGENHGGQWFVLESRILREFHDSPSLWRASGNAARPREPESRQRPECKGDQAAGLGRGPWRSSVVEIRWLEALESA